MVMPKGQTFNHGYATSFAGYREISEYMTDRGDKMNHATARNVFLSAMTKLCEGVVARIGEGKIDPQVIARDPRFQSAIEAYLRDVHQP
jgi:hypothetical protein